MLVVDTWVWIEIVAGGSLGPKALAAIRGKELLTTSANLYEVRNYLVRSHPDWERRLQSILAQCVDVISIDADVAELASDLKKENPEMGAVDCFTLAAARLAGASVVTGDPHFEGCRGVVFLK